MTTACAISTWSTWTGTRSSSAWESRRRHSPDERVARNPGAPHIARCAGSCGLRSERPVEPAGEQVDRAAVGVVARIDDELIIERELGRGGERVAVIGFENLLRAGARQLAVADEDPEAAGVEESLVHAGSSVDHGGDAERVVGAAPLFTVDRHPA